MPTQLRWGFWDGVGPGNEVLGPITGRRVLDVGSGAGHYAVHLAIAHGALIDAVDLSPTQHQRAISHFGAVPGVRFLLPGHRPDSAGPGGDLEVLGPLLLSAISKRRVVSLVWAGLALAGVFLLGQDGFGRLNPAGVAFALGAGAMWAAYIVFNSRAGARFPRLDGLAVAMAVAALVSLPLGIGSAGTTLLEPGVLGLGLAVALLSSGLPYTLELLPLRRLPAPTFAVLMSLAPEQWPRSPGASHEVAASSGAPADRLQRGLHRAESDSVLTHQGPVRHTCPGITADRRVQVDLGLRWGHHTLIPQSTSMLPPQSPQVLPELNSRTSPSGETRCSRP